MKKLHQQHILQEFPRRFTEYFLRVPFYGPTLANRHFQDKGDGTNNE